MKLLQLTLPQDPALSFNTILSPQLTWGQTTDKWHELQKPQLYKKVKVWPSGELACFYCFAWHNILKNNFESYFKWNH